MAKEVFCEDIKIIFNEFELVNILFDMYTLQTYYCALGPIIKNYKLHLVCDDEDYIKMKNCTILYASHVAYDIYCVITFNVDYIQDSDLKLAIRPLNNNFKNIINNNYFNQVICEIIHNYK